MTASSLHTSDLGTEICSNVWWLCFVLCPVLSWDNNWKDGPCCFVLLLSSSSITIELIVLNSRGSYIMLTVIKYCRTDAVCAVTDGDWTVFHYRAVLLLRWRVIGKVLMDAYDNMTLYTTFGFLLFCDDLDVLGYSYAPVLLNARAILKCKANLNSLSFPVIFLFLEGSCMRQIRNIFGLTSNDFSPTSTGKWLCSEMLKMCYISGLKKIAC